jgi:hypothetical protein
MEDCGMKDYKWAIRDSCGQYWDVEETRIESIRSFLPLRVTDELRRDWRWYRRRGYRCVKVRIVEVEKYKETVRRYTPDDELVDSAPVDGVHIERLDDGTAWIRVGETVMHFIARRRGVLEWLFDGICDDVEVEK